MSVIWKFCCLAADRKSGRHALFLTLNVLLFALAGLAVWLILRNWCLDGAEWAVVFAGFPAALAGFFGGIIYLYNV